jgi:alpha-galactosidase
MHRPRSRRWLPLVCLAVLAMCTARTLADADVPVAAQNGSAFIQHQTGTSIWAIGDATIQFVVGFDASGNLIAESLTNPASGAALDIDQAPDTSVTLGGDRLTLNQSNGKMSLVSTATDVTDTGVRLSFTFEHKVLHTKITRVYACYDGSPTIETWTKLEAAIGAPAVEVSNLSGWQLTMPNGPVRWINGLRGDSATQEVPVGDSFAFDGGDLDEGQTLIGSSTRSSELFVPFIFMQAPDQQFYGGMIWSGSWQIAMNKSGDRVQLVAGFPGVSTSLTSAHAVEVPHTFFGMTDPGGSPADALRQFVFQGIRRGRGISPLVTYNTWYPYGASIAESDVDEEMHRAAAIGVELFVLDAGWWTGAGAAGPGDFSSGLGNYAVDTERFPAQLIGQAAQAHSLNMKFGLWVEPERVALSLLGGPGMPQEAWLATAGGSYASDGQTAQLCLASAAARKWVFTQIANLIDRVQPDYIKWDNNFWINCDRAGHGHGPADGNFQHVLGLYALLDELRQRYPDLLIENVSGGGNRLDYGMMAYTDSAWMDDLTAQ